MFPRGGRHGAHGQPRQELYLESYRKVSFLSSLPSSVAFHGWCAQGWKSRRGCKIGVTSPGNHRAWPQFSLFFCFGGAEARKPAVLHFFGWCGSIDWSGVTDLVGGAARLFSPVFVRGGFLYSA